jgi:hypothetical protein
MVYPARDRDGRTADERHGLTRPPTMSGRTLAAVYTEVRREVRPWRLSLDQPSVQTKALGVQARTLETYARLGIAERAVELGGAHLVEN